MYGWCGLVVVCLVIPSLLQLERFNCHLFQQTVLLQLASSCYEWINMYCQLTYGSDWTLFSPEQRVNFLRFVTVNWQILTNWRNTVVKSTTFHKLLDNKNTFSEIFIIINANNLNIRFLLGFYPINGRSTLSASTTPLVFLKKDRQLLQFLPVYVQTWLFTSSLLIFEGVHVKRCIFNNQPLVHLYMGGGAFVRRGGCIREFVILSTKEFKSSKLSVCLNINV